MTGTPSKDRAEAHMAAAHKLWLAGMVMLRDQKGDPVSPIAAALDNAFAEGMKRAAEIAQEPDPDKPSNWLHRREDLPAAILAEIGER